MNLGLNNSSEPLRATFASRAAFFLIAATIVWTTLIYGTVHQPILSLFYISVALIMLLWMVDTLISGDFRFDADPVQVPLAAAVLYGVIQIIPLGFLPVTGGVEDIPWTISVDPFKTQVAAFHLAALFAFLAASLRFTVEKRRLKSLVQLIAIFGSVYAFYSILQLVLSPKKIYGIYSPSSIYAVPFGSFVNRNNFAAFIEMTIAVPAGLLLAGAISKDKRLLYLTGLGLMGVSLLLSGSRGGLVAIVAGLCFLVIVTRRPRSRRSKGLRIAAGIILIVSVVAGAVMIGEESTLTRIADSADSPEISINRTEIWKATLPIIAKNMPFGVGMGAFGVAYTEFDRFNGLERVEQAHNDYLEVIATTGLVGTAIGLLFVFFLFRLGLRGLRAKDRFIHGAAAGALAGCFAILVHSLFDFVLHTTAIALLFLTLVAILGAAARLARLEFKAGSERRGNSNVTPISVEESA